MVELYQVVVKVKRKDYQQFLEKSVLPKSGDGWRIGKEKFARKLALEFNAGLTSDEVVAEAERTLELRSRGLCWARFASDYSMQPSDSIGVSLGEHWPDRPD